MALKHRHYKCTREEFRNEPKSGKFISSRKRPTNEDWKTNVEDQVYTTNILLNKTEKEKDIGVVTGNKLNFSDHLGEKVNKANRIVNKLGIH